jgi:hypothetical protein
VHDGAPAAGDAALQQLREHGLHVLPEQVVEQDLGQDQPS